MSLEKLKWLRLIAPAIIFLVFVALLGLFTGLWTIQIPTDLDKAVKSLLTLLIGGIYYIFPFRESANQRYFDQVSENIRRKLLSVAGLSDDAAIYTWKKVRRIFFSIVDSDESLRKQASLAYFNGFIWTTIADIRALAVLFLMLSLWIAATGIDYAIISAIIFGLIALATKPLSRRVTEKHIHIGDEQIEIIQQNHIAELRKKLDAIAQASMGGGSKPNG